MSCKLVAHMLAQVVKAALEFPNQGSLSFATKRK